jgi:hypothetical protein
MLCLPGGPGANFSVVARSAARNDA